MNIQNILDKIIKESEYTFGTVKITSKPIQGVRLGYAGGSNKGKIVSGYIVIDSRFIEKGKIEEVENTIKHEVAHLIAETFNKKKKTGVWHGQLWKDIFIELGGNGERYYTGSFIKPENIGKTLKTKAELMKITPKQPATDWEQGTYRQWLERGYHVIKGQKGHLKVWEFSANEYETDEDGKTSDWGRARAVYFTNGQVEPNERLE
jgi:hypothetical protein